MIRVIILLHFFIFLLSNSVPANNNIASIIRGIQKNYAHLPGFRISYKREVITRTMSFLGNQIKGDIATGKIFFRPPYSLKLEQEKPQPETIIAGKETVWWYIPGEKRVYKYPSGKFGKELMLLSDIFRGLINVDDNFTVSLLTQDKQGEYRIKLIPQPPWEEINSIIITVTNRFEIHRINIQNQLGGVTRFELDDLAMMDKFDDGFFIFEIPKGVQVIQDNGLSLTP